MQFLEGNKEDPGSMYLSEKRFFDSIATHGKGSDHESTDSLHDHDKDSDDESTESHRNQLVLYKLGACDTGLEIKCLPDSSDRHISFPRLPVRKHSSRTSPSIGTFTVQCARCLQWRVIPTKEKYEKIREKILQEPFYCKTAQEWRPKVSCADPPDISQDGSRLWAIDKPNIAQAPPGWERSLRIRAEGGTRFADVYYISPSGKRLRSMVEVQKYLLDHPGYASQGVSLSQFSFQTPKPLQENYVRKRPHLTADADDCTDSRLTRTLEPEEVSPLSWACPLPNTELQLKTPGASASHDEPPVYHSLFEEPLAKKMAVRRPSQQVDNCVSAHLGQRQSRRPL